MNLLLYKLFGESRNAHQERQDLAHAISLMTELGEAKRRNAESEPDEDAKWSITFDQIKEFFEIIQSEFLRSLLLENSAPRIYGIYAMSVFENL